MFNKFKIENNLTQATTSSSVVRVTTTSFSQTTTTFSSGAYSRTELRSTSSGAPSITITGYPSAPSISPGSNLIRPSDFDRLTTARSSYQGASGSSYTPSGQFRSAFNNSPGAPYRSFNTGLRLPAITQQPAELEPKKSKSLLSIFSSSSNKDKGDKDKQSNKNKDKEKKDKPKKEKEKKEKQSKKVNGTKAVATVDARSMGVGDNNGDAPYFSLGDMEKKLTIKVIKYGRFYPLDTDKIPTYETKTKARRGQVLLINNINFPKDKYRAGAQVDHENIIKLFRAMGFTVTDHKNKRKQEMEKIITDYCRSSSLKYADINVTIVMSHGNGKANMTYIETMDNLTIESEWIANQFSNSNCQQLANKPKIFIFQCCRGAAEDTTQTDATQFQPPRTNADMLLAYATVPGFVSHRDPKFGTWYVQWICKIFMEHAHDTDVEHLLKMVDHNLEKNYINHRQTSSYENRGFKRCYLNPV